ncbi:glutamate--cysteine ligase [Aliidiomarina sedimenti]|uniref:Glutamate--cysteine ligase n=1 Tax=Aliidiomarina sedimenti TaxID=1933879 RepID=A0ABY0BWX5_9GAMM|nr:glutamate--cysteine ligase [Aliidiomarina sedimenti]RUO28864.1 glutamate--cysteine ligase [Aliidiomarina sedimenti]
MNLSARLDALRQRQQTATLAGINRGVERETLRITNSGQLAQTMHPQSLGATLTHPLITTDYAESLLEFITPVSRSVRETLTQLRDLHRFTYRHIGDELLWPLSMPCYVNEPKDIRIADFGSSHVGMMKSTYRQGLTHRYGAVMQTIAGVHYNFSVSDQLWDELAAQDGAKNCSDYRSERYFDLIRNFLKHAWVVPYFFGASPVVCSSFTRYSPGDVDLQSFGGGMSYRPYATALRMSDLGYTNKEQAALRISYDSAQQYIDGLRRAVSTPSERFAKIGVQDDQGEFRQLNSNILQIENEFYAPIRPKRTAHSGETPTQALERGGVEYIEIRALDTNPYTPVGITAEQMLFLDLLLMHCLLSDSPKMSWDDQQQAGRNLTQVVLDGRDPRLRLQQGQHQVLLKEQLKDLFKTLEPLAELMDNANGGDAYRCVLGHLGPQIDNPERTLSGQLIADMRKAQQHGQGFAMQLAQHYREQLLQESLEYYSEDELKALATKSLTEQSTIESQQSGTFAAYLQAYFAAAEEKKERAC